MNAVAQRRPAAVSPPGRSIHERITGVVVALWGAVTGVLPHVLHHVGPLAGAALLAGAGGKLLFGAVGFVLSVPFLLRLYRRFETWIAPAIALGVFIAAFSFSTFVIGPLITGEGGGSSPKPGLQQPGGHAEHHGGG
jgi:hypothetical protein